MKNNLRYASRFFMSSWKNFSNIHKGESCYIFGNGPSIKWFDLNYFRDKPAISTGQLHYHKDCYKLTNIKYFALIEPWFFVSKIPRFFFDPSKKHSKLIDDVQVLVEDYKNFINKSNGREFFINLSNLFSIRGNNIHYAWRRLPNIRNSTDELLNNYDLFSGSFYASLSLAYYFGFSEIYLIGFDAMTIEPTRNIRFYEFGKGDIGKNTPDACELLEIFKNEMNIYTISVDGKSKNVINISYEDYTNTKPVYKENHEIMNDYYLEMTKDDPASKANKLGLEESGLK